MSAYQKEIADDHYYFARSCIRQNFSRLQKLYIDILRNVLGKDIYDDSRQNYLYRNCLSFGVDSSWNYYDCNCPSVCPDEWSRIWNFVVSVLPPLGSILKRWIHGSIFRKQKRNAWSIKTCYRDDFSIPKNIVHASDVIYKFRKEIAEKITLQLKNKSTGELLNCRSYRLSLCQIFPQEGIGGAEYPYVLAGLIDEWGGHQVDYPNGVTVAVSASDNICLNRTDLIL